MSTWLILKILINVNVNLVIGSVRLGWIPIILVQIRYRFFYLPTCQVPVLRQWYLLLIFYISLLFSFFHFHHFTLRLNDIMETLDLVLWFDAFLDNFGSDFGLVISWVVYTSLLVFLGVDRCPFIQDRILLELHKFVFNHAYNWFNLFFATTLPWKFSSIQSISYSYQFPTFLFI